jgi:hypothetical protein
LNKTLSILNLKRSSFSGGLFFGGLNELFFICILCLSSDKYTTLLWMLNLLYFCIQKLIFLGGFSRFTFIYNIIIRDSVSIS